MNAKEARGKEISMLSTGRVQWCEFEGKARLPFSYRCVLDDDMKNEKEERKIYFLSFPWAGIKNLIFCGEKYPKLAIKNLKVKISCF